MTFLWALPFVASCFRTPSKPPGGARSVSARPGAGVSKVGPDRDRGILTPVRKANQAQSAFRGWGVLAECAYPAKDSVSGTAGETIGAIPHDFDPRAAVARAIHLPPVNSTIASGPRSDHNMAQKY